jgi:hypothetical protein
MAAREGKRLECIPADIVNDVLARVETILS